MSDRNILEIQQSDDAVIALVRCETFDLEKTESLRRELREVMAGSDRRPFLLDMSRVETVVSHTLGALVELARHVSENRRSLALVKVSEKIQVLLEASAIDRLFAIFDDHDQAIASI